MSDPKPFRPLSLDDLFNLDLPDPEWLVDGLVPLGASTLLDAREKAGKGLLTIDLCAAVSLGEPFLNRAVREGPAIYCAAEEHTRDVRARIAARIGAERSAPLYVLPLNGSTDDRLDLANPETMQRLSDMIAELRPVLVVLDTLRELHRHAEDSSDEMGPLLRPVRQLAHTFNVALVVNHHQNKGGGSRGSTAIRASFDQTLSFHRPDEKGDGGPSGTLFVEGRFGPRVNLPIRLGEGLHWEEAAPIPIVAEPDTRQRVLAWLNANDRDDGATASDIATGTEIALKTIQNMMTAFRKESSPPVIAAGRGQKNAALRYRVAAPPLPFECDRDHSQIVPPVPTLLRGPGGKEQSKPPPLIVPQTSRTNGSNGRVCVECGAGDGPGALYCERHGGGPGADRWPQ